MAHKKFSIIGRVINQSTDQGVSKLRIEAWDNDLFIDDLVGEAVTDENGAFHIEFTEKHYKEWFFDRHPDLFFKVFHKNKCILSTEKSVLWNIKTEKTKILLNVDIPVEPAPREPSFSVSGEVRLSDNSLMRDSVLVRAYDQGLRRRVILGEGKTTENGQYQISYDQSQLLDPGRGNANLVVEALGKRNGVLAASKVHFHAGARETISLTVKKDAGQSQWEHINARLMPVLEETPADEIQEEEYPFLEKSTNLTREQLQRRVQAARVAMASTLPDWFHFGLLQQGMTREFDTLLDLPVSKIQQTITAAIKAVDIPNPSQEQMEKLWQQFKALQTEYVLRKPLPGSGSTLGKVFDLAGIKAKDQDNLALALNGKNINDPMIREHLVQETQLAPEIFKRVRLTIRTMSLVDESAGMVAALLQDKRISEIRDLAKYYGPDDWVKLVEDTTHKDGGDLPESEKNMSLNERRQQFANTIYTRVSESYPHLSVVYSLSRHPELAENPAIQMLPEIVETDPAFDLGSVRIDAYIRENKERLGIKDDDVKEKAFLDGLKQVQRVYRLRAEPRAVALLLNDGMHSSSAIMNLGRGSFIKKYGKELGSDVVRGIYQRAEITVARAMAVAVRFSPVINTTPTPAAIRKCPAALKGVPDYPTLFGSLDGCDCMPCESVYSPAAYLTDLLSFIEREVEPVEEDDNFPDNGLDAIRNRFFCDRNGMLKNQPRRPDIPETKLSCRNADTQLPYVDLILEILENAVVPRGGETPQTTLTAEELEAQPEHCISAVYDKLARALFPFCLPFDLRYEEASIYLDKLGTSTAELLETFYPFIPDDDSSDTPCDSTDKARFKDTGIAAARLGLGDIEWRLIAGIRLSPAHAASESWGYSINDGSDWWHPLRVVDTFLKRSGLEYNDLFVLIHLQSCNPDGHLQLKFEDLNDCDPEKISIEKLDTKILSWLHRFLRLQRATDFSMEDLDLILRKLAVEFSQKRPVPEAKFLVRLSHLIIIRQRFGLKLPELLSWWAPIDTVENNIPGQPTKRSFYATLFLDGRAGEPQFDAFQPVGDGSLDSSSLRPLTDTVAVSVLCTVLRISSVDLQALIADVIPQPDPKLTLSNISTLFRHSSLARNLQLSINDYLVLKRLTGFDPFTKVEGIDNTAQTLRFLEYADTVRYSDFSIGELDFILGQTEPYDSEHTIAPSENWITAGLDALQVALEPLSPLKGPRNAVAEALKALDAPDDLISGDLLNSLLVSALEESEMLDEAVVGESLVLLLLETLELASPGENISDIKGQLLQKLTEVSDILADILSLVLAQECATLLDLDSATARALLKVVRPTTDAFLSAEKMFFNSFAPLETDEDSVATSIVLEQVLRRLHKTALLAAKLTITPAHLPWLVEQSNVNGWLDLSILPVKEEDENPSLFSWVRLIRLLEFRDALLPEQQVNLPDLLNIAKEYETGSPDPASKKRRDYSAYLAELSGWDEDDLLALIGNYDFGAVSHGGGGIVKATFPEQFVDERLPWRILQVVRLLQRLKTTAVDVSGWIIVDQRTRHSNIPQVHKIKQALKACTRDDWNDILKSLRDPLREKQRQALIAFLLHEWNLKEPADFYDHFLIDVEMSPCMMTSRLIQATAAVQLFVQRVTMNLEPGLALSEDGSGQWEWMKNYRIWEANRKIFLYPENWIEPDLRDDKTPFFKDLENELLQGDISNETAETALMHYLEKLHEVANLQICGQYVDQSGNNSLEFHVFGRTRDKPHRYYYRRGILEVDSDTLQNNMAKADFTRFAEHSEKLTSAAINVNWTPWERVDVDIEGDHLVPIVYNRRMYLFWPVFTSEDEAPYTHTLQILLSMFGQMFQLLGAIGDLIQGLVQGVGAVVIGGLTNSTIELLYSIQYGFNDLIPGPGPLDLLNQRNRIREIRKALFHALGVPENASTDDSVIMVEQAGLRSFDDLGKVFQDVADMVENYEQYLLAVLPAKRLEVKLSWSEFKNDSWTTKKTSANAVTFCDVISTFFENLPELPGLGREGVKRLFTFRAAVEQKNQLCVHCNIALPTSLFNIDTYTTEDWLSKPEEIGFFRYETSSGQLEAVDTEENIGFGDLVSQLVSQAFTVADDTLSSLQGDRQLQRRGAPVTPDDDPSRPSELRSFLEDVPLPQHYLPTDHTPDDYRILARHQATVKWEKLVGFFYQDTKRLFFCLPCPARAGNPANFRAINFEDQPKYNFVFVPFYHPFSGVLLSKVQQFGVSGLYDVRYGEFTNGYLEPAVDGQPLQIALNDETYFSDPEYKPVTNVYNLSNGHRALRPIEEIDFSTIGSYSQYNWEIFFHVPFLIASRLSTDQKFKEAQHWFHYIFNPTDASRGSVPEKYWRTKPFVETSSENYEQQQITELLQFLNAEEETPGLQELEWAVHQWRKDAFNPHLIARARTAAFQKAVVMKYIDNLIDWGDSLFRQETRESVYEAIQLYILAGKLLGPRPQQIQKDVVRQEYTYIDLLEKHPIDEFSNVLVEVENYLPLTASGVNRGSQPFEESKLYRLDQGSLAPVGDGWKVLVRSRSLNNILLGNRSGSEKMRKTDESLYFCVPPNMKLLEKWDTVVDRLFKIRHCRNIDGRKLELPLLAPPIDPAILVRARAAGVDINDIMVQINAPLPQYRFQVMVQKATDLCNDVRSLGSALLSAMEKRDGEELALLRNTQEKRLLNAVEDIKEQQIKDVAHALTGLRKSQEATTLRLNHYIKLLQTFMNPEEITGTVLNAASIILQTAQFSISWGAASASMAPDIKAGFVTTLGATFGGKNLGMAAGNIASSFGALASVLSSSGGQVSTMGGYRRRAENWLLQIQTTSKELEGLDEQIASAEIRLDIAKSDLENHKLQIENNSELNDFMQQKFTSKELYDWMVSQTSTLYFQSYQMACDLAYKAQRAYSFELGVDTPGIIPSTHWDNLKKGLLAGDHLHQDLKRLEVAYLEKNIREYEMTKHVSLLSIDPVQLIALRETGKAIFNLPEAFFDLDFPGHYFRRIKSVSISIPCVTGPYSGINATLALIKSRIRCQPYLSENGNNDIFTQNSPFLVNRTPTRAVATSTGQNDTGLFELNFRDERYLPFEGEGVESEWELTMNKDFAQFDFDTISDVVLHVKYTARDGGVEFKGEVIEKLKGIKNAFTTIDGEQPLTRLFSVRQEFPTEWAKFRAQKEKEAAPTHLFELTLDIRTEHYPFWIHGCLDKINGMSLWASSSAGDPPENIQFTRSVNSSSEDGLDMLRQSNGGDQSTQFGDLFYGTFNNTTLPEKPNEKLVIYFDTNEMSDLWIAVFFGRDQRLTG